MKDLERAIGVFAELEPPARTWVRGSQAGCLALIMAILLVFLVAADGPWQAILVCGVVLPVSAYLAWHWMRPAPPRTTLELVGYLVRNGQLEWGRFDVTFSRPVATREPEPARVVSLVRQEVTDPRSPAGTHLDVALGQAGDDKSFYSIADVALREDDEELCCLPNANWGIWLLRGDTARLLSNEMGKGRTRTINANLMANLRALGEALNTIEEPDWVRLTIYPAEWSRLGPGIGFGLIGLAFAEAMTTARRAEVRRQLADGSLISPREGQRLEALLEYLDWPVAILRHDHES